MEVTRRHFLGGATAAAIVAGMKPAGRVFGANDAIAVACVGIRGQGNSHMKAYCGMPKEARVVALCDVDKDVLDQRVKEAKQLQQGHAPKAYRDVRDLLDNKSIDVVTTATPNHWHSLLTIWACQAGKDVYVEKPISHNVWEGRQAVAAAQKYNRIVQHGTQNRSDPEWMRDINALHNGIIGEVYMARALCYKRRDSIDFKPFEAPPKNLDWNLWQGPAEESEFCRNYVHYNWHWFWRYGNGDIGNQGVHQMDIGTWGMNKGLPVEVFSTGGRYTYKDQGETPNTQVATFKYADGSMMVFEVRGRATNSEGGSGDKEGVRVGNLFYGSEGYYVEGQGFFNMKGEPIPVQDPKPESKGRHGNFLNAVRTRKQEDIHGNALDAHISSAHCHLANISYRIGCSLRFDPEKEQFVGDHSDKANELLRRNYRKDFEVPQLA